jgi:hypothetical protein
VTELHEKYAPILHFNKDEHFYPMRADDMLHYSSLYTKGQSQPVVALGKLTPEKIVRHSRSSEVFLRSVEAGPMYGPDVIAEWGAGVLEMVYRWAAAKPKSLAQSFFRKAYTWFSPKTAEAAGQFWWNDLVAPVLEGALETASRSELPRLILPGTTQRNAVERYHSSFNGSPDYTYYYRQVQDGDFLCLQYWFFYSYNDWGQSFAGMNDHEGDWEGMMLFFRLDSSGRPQEPPAYVTYADHESRQTKPWGHPDTSHIGTHPVGFVAAGSHATYPAADTHTLMKLYNLVDYATGDGATIDHDDWVHRIDLDQVRWLGDYKGSWGTRFWLRTAEVRKVLGTMVASAPLLRPLLELSMPADEFELPGVSAPRGPVGPHRAQYALPAQWAGLGAMGRMDKATPDEGGKRGFG